MLTIEAARQQILGRIHTLPARRLPLLEALGCVLSEDIAASEPLPPFTNSAMDGYAVQTQDCLGEISILRVAGLQPAGSLENHRVEPGTAIRIMTGAPLPDGADAVVPIESTETQGHGHVRILGKVTKNQHIRPQGEEVKPGEKILSKGRVLKPADIGLLASLGVTQISVIPRPQVSVLTTGNEVVDPALRPGPGQIRNSNLSAISASVIESGSGLATTAHVGDDAIALEQALSACVGDVIITCGGVSVGDYDFVKTVLAKRGEVYFWKVAIKPGKPFVFGRWGHAWLFGLPGNPVSSLVAFEVLVRPALKALAGFEPFEEEWERARLSRPLRHKPGRREFVRARVYSDEGGWVAEALPWQGSGMLRSLTEANGWIVVPEESAGLATDELVSVWMRR